ncbi:hypothetical protein D3C74_469630 [compost metagenome]
MIRKGKCRHTRKRQLFTAKQLEVLTGFGGFGIGFSQLADRHLDRLVFARRNGEFSASKGVHHR